MNIWRTLQKDDLRTGRIVTALLLAVGLSGCDNISRPTYQGYVEGDFVYISSETSGRLVTLLVKRGEQVTEGQKLALLDYDSQLRQLAIEDGNLKSEQAKLNDLNKGQRREELDVVQARIAQAKQEAKIAASKLARYKKIKPQGYISDFEFQQAEAESRQKHEHVNELLSQLESNKLPSRPDQLLAQQARVNAAREALSQRQIELDKRTLASASSAVVYDTIAHEGEIITPGQPVVSLLPRDAIKIRFFIPNSQLHKIAPGKKIRIWLDGINTPVAAHVNFISPKAEYTPPVIYSKEQRERMVFMIEAVPDAYTEVLKPGQPVEVQL